MSKRIFWAGDSTVKKNDFTSFPQTGLGQGFQLFIKDDYSIENYGQNGRSTKSFITEKRLAAIEERIEEGDYLFIQFGHNDEKPDEGRHTEPYGSYMENLKIYINVAREHKAYPLLITPLYRRLFKEDKLHLIDSTHLDYPDACIKLAKEMDVPVIDLCTLSKNLIEETGYSRTEQWFVHVQPGIYDNFPEGKSDETHLTYEGAYWFSKILSEELIKIGGVYADIIRPVVIEENGAWLLKD